MALEVFHAHERLALVFANFIGSNDIGVGEPRGDPGLGQKLAMKLIAGVVVVVQHLDDDESLNPAEPALERQQRLTHAAATEAGDDLKLAYRVDAHGPMSTVLPFELRSCSTVMPTSGSRVRPVNLQPMSPPADGSSYCPFLLLST